jgi:hypothetical protein
VSLQGVPTTSVFSGSGALACAAPFAGSIAYTCDAGVFSSSGACTCAAGYAGPTCASCAPNYVASGTACIAALFTFTKASNADPSLPANQDCLKANVCLTRGTTRSLYNAADPAGPAGANEPVCTDVAPTSVAPTGTLWAKGSCSAPTTAFGIFLGATYASCSPPTLVNVPSCLYLPAYGEYYDLTFTSWAQNGGGGGFSYARSAAPVRRDP